MVPARLDEPQDPIAAIQARLRKYPQARVEMSANQVLVHPSGPNGFEVMFRVRPGRYQVYCAGWHEDFTSSKEALDCFAFSLSTACRLKVSSRGGMAYRWELQFLQNGRWIADSEVGLWFFPFWRPLKVAYFQNHLLEAA